jgi:anti-sigma B factor antagonist
MLDNAGIPDCTSARLPVVFAPAEIDIENAEQFGAALLRASHEGSTVVVDMSQTVFCDSRAISELVRAAKRATAEGGELRLAACTAPVLRIMSVTGVDQLLVLRASVADALAGHRDAGGPDAGSAAAG